MYKITTLVAGALCQTSSCYALKSGIIFWSRNFCVSLGPYPLDCFTTYNFRKKQNWSYQRKVHQLIRYLFIWGFILPPLDLKRKTNLLSRKREKYKMTIFHQGYCFLYGLWTTGRFLLLMKQLLNSACGRAARFGK